MYDFLIVGAGLYGSVFAHQARLKGKTCLVIDKRKHAGGNVYCENIEGINVHMYGAHIFHTNDKEIWDYVNSLAEFRQYTHSPVARYGNKIYNLPFNMNTFYQIWGITDPDLAKQYLQQESKQNSRIGNYKPIANLEEQAISLVGKTIYQLLIKYYTQKQWGRDCKDLPASIIKRLPVRFTFDNNYFDDKYQGMPVGGYNPLIAALLSGVEVRTGIDYFSNPDHFNGLARTVVYTGPIDQFFNYRFGALEYRSLEFKHSHHLTDNYQGCSVVNYTGPEEKFTRIIEHKHFQKTVSSNTVITHEYPAAWSPGAEPYYPIGDQKNDALFRMYRDLAAQTLPNTIFGGRLAEYRYYDMHQVIASALKTSREVLK